MKFAMVAVLGLLVLGGGGAGAYYYFLGGAAQAAATQDGEEVADAAKAKEAGGHDGAEAAKPEYVQLDPLILPIINAQGLTQTISLVITIEVPDVAMSEKVTALSPRLKDAYIQDLYGALGRQASTQGGVVDVGTIKARLNAITRRVMGEDFAGDVLLQVVQQRPI